MINKTIYLAIPSTEDKEILKTVENAFSAADNPNRVFMGISFFDTTDELFVKVKEMNNRNIVCDYHKLTNNSFDQMGTGNGRYRALQMYSGQDFFLQIDSHTRFDKGWDTTLISLFEEFKGEYGNDKFMFTGYPAKYEYNSNGERVLVDSELYYPYFYPEQFFLNRIPKWDMIKLDESISKKFIPCVKFCGGFVFGSKYFAENSGVYKDAIFYDEEMVQSFNLIGNDIAMVFLNIENFPIAHLYTDNINEYGGKREYFAHMFKKKYDTEFSNKCVDNYLKFIDDPKNKGLIKKYEKYAKINVKKGAISNGYIPKVFIVEES